MHDLFKHLVAEPESDPGQARWRSVRRPARECDPALTGTTRRWLRALPARRRPLRLCETHPRVANRIAWCWPDMALSSAVLEDLLVDRRSGRQGFAPDTVRELQRLRDFNTQQRVEISRESLLARAARVVGVG